MPVSTWKSRDERQYRAILKNCRRGARDCKRIAAATVNKRRRAKGGLGLSPGLSGSHTDHLVEMLRLVSDLQDQETSARSCVDAQSTSRTHARAIQEWLNLRKTMPDDEWLRVGQVIDRMGPQIQGLIADHCREKDCRKLRWGGYDSTLSGVGNVEPLLTRGFKEGRKSWIDVMPTGGPKMRVTHEVLEGLGRATPPPIPAHARRKCLAWRFEGRNRVCAIYDNESEPSVFAFGRPSGVEGLGDIKRKKLSKAERERRQREIDRASEAAYKRMMDEFDARVWEKEPKKKFDPNLNGFEGVGSSLAMMWAAAGAVMLLALSDAQRDKLFSPTPNAEAEATLVSLNAARARQGLPPLTR